MGPGTSDVRAVRANVSKEFEILVGAQFLIAGTVVDATATELNYIADVTPGTAAASKALVLGSSKEIATITSATITTLTTTTVTSAALVLNSTAEMNIQIAGVSVLAIDDAAITGNAGAADTAGQDVYIETQDGGPAITSEAGPNGADYRFKSGDGSQGFDTEDEDGGAAGFIGRTGGNGGRAGLLSGGTANGGNGGNITDTAGNGGNGGDASGTDGNGGSYSVDAGSPGTGGNAAGVNGNVTIGAAKAERVNIGRTGKTTTMKGVIVTTEDAFFAQDVHTSESTGAQSIAAADFVNGIVVHSVAAASTLTTPTGAQITAVLPAGVGTGHAFYLRVITIGTGSDDVSTLTAGDGDITFVGDVTVGPNDGITSSYATWIFRIANIATDEYVGYRVG